MTRENASAGRRLNMEEKRKLEKLLFADIEKAVAAYQITRDKDRNDLIARAIKSPKAVRLFETWQKAKSEMKRLEEDLKALGFGINSYPKDELYVQKSSIIEPLEKFDTETTKARNALTEMKRVYTLKLFAGGEEAQTLFESLAKELASIVR